MPKSQQEEKQDSDSSGKIWWLIGAIILFVIFLLSSFFGLGYYLGRLPSFIILAAAIALFVIYFSHKTKIDKKVYKANSPPQHMKIQYIFYIVGVIFIFASVWYFAREFIDELPDPIKLTLLIIAVIVSFIIAEFLRGADK